MTPEPVQVTATATPPPEVVLEIPQECLDALDVAQSTLALDLEAFEAQAAALDAAKEAIRAGLDNRTVAFDDAVARMNEAEDSVSVDAVVGARDSFVSNRHACLVAVMD
ncbi:hypothetical protein [uncultured Demequina sp.]|uniref:hypothetical protein n=1 Tax=uncultured Demequina sp. TaxID=693499 RepID=UPI0025EDBFD5|nr:hypothetical protein [uncultured Demequina sp.]